KYCSNCSCCCSLKATLSCLAPCVSSCACCVVTVMNLAAPNLYWLYAFSNAPSITRLLLESHQESVMLGQEFPGDCWITFVEFLSTGLKLPCNPYQPAVLLLR